MDNLPAVLLALLIWILIGIAAHLGNIDLPLQP